MIRMPGIFSCPLSAAVAFAAVVAAVMLQPLPAFAHPHVWIVAREKLVFDQAGELTAIQHEWTFDKPYSAYIVQGLDTNRDGIYSEEELAPLARENAEGLVDFDYFTILKVLGKKQEFDAPRDYRMSFANGALTLHFSLPLKTPVKAPKVVGLEIYDESYFISFSFATQDDAVTLSGNARGCAITVTRPKQAEPQELAKFSEDYFANAGMGLQFANKAVVACP